VLAVAVLCSRGFRSPEDGDCEQELRVSFLVRSSCLQWATRFLEVRGWKAGFPSSPVRSLPAAVSPTTFPITEKSSELVLQDFSGVV